MYSIYSFAHDNAGRYKVRVMDDFDTREQAEDAAEDYMRHYPNRVIYVECRTYPDSNY